jgi:hypothetical protein
MMDDRAAAMSSSMATMRFGVALAMGACVSLVGLRAQAQDTPQSRYAAVAPRADRPYTQAEFGVGMLTLPASKFCLSAPSSCTRGDISPEAYVLMLFRPNRSFGIGAGVALGLPSGSEQSQSPYNDVDRSHSRSYLMIDVVGRYYALQLPTLDGWVGGPFGGVVISDQYTNNADNPSAPILGPKGVIIRTEGVSLGLEAGFAWSFARNWSIGGVLRSARWVLPSTQECAPTGDCATLSGSNSMFSLVGTISYRIGL